MNPPFRIPAIIALALTSPSFGGERLMVDGYARQSGGGVLLGLSPAGAAVFSVPEAPSDRSFVPPSRVKWEMELTGGTSEQGLPVAIALRSAPDSFAWPEGEEHSPARYAGASNSMNPFENHSDPLGVAPGGPPDSDQDGVPDGEDPFPGDPAESLDTDGDRIGNNADPDDDNDGMPDAWETSNGLNPLFANGSYDADGDGQSNLAEYEAGTAPGNPASRFEFESITSASPGVMRLTWRGVPGRTYSLWHSTTLSIGPQLMEDNITVAASSLITRELPAATARDFFFLRARVTSNP
jgi:hypothetical protein